ncbi:MAG: PKD domain-containing protein, partial [Methanomicrobiales archaeon]
MSPRLRVMWFALLFCLGLLLLVPVTFAAPTPFARIDLDHPQELRNMTVSNVEVIDLMDPSLSRVTLFSTNGDGSDTKIIPLPSLQTVRRIFSERVAFCKDYTLTVLGPLDSTVSVAGLGEYTVFIRPHLPVVRCQVPGATADIVMAKVNASSRQVDISGLVSSTDMAYLLQDPRGVLAMQQHPQVIGAYGSWTSADYNASDLSFTFVHNQFDISDYTLDRGIARSVSNLTAFISGTPPKPGEYLISAFQYSPVDQKATTYAAWPVVILDGNNRFVFVGKSTPYQYDLMSGEDLVLTFENPTRINNLTYILIKDGENYDAQVDVNMTALEESPDESGLDVILSGNLFLTLLKDTGTASPVLQNIISYSITRQGSPPTIQPPHNHEINITPGYGISGYALNSTYVVIGQDNLTTLKEVSFRVYAMGLDGKNDIVALDYGKLLIGVVPNINFSGQPTGGTAPLQVQFTDTTTGNPTSWSWSFGDGTANDTARNPVHQYQNAGTYDVTLTASNGGLSSVMAKPRYISVTTPGLHADFSGQPTGGTAPLQVQFT